VAEETSNPEWYDPRFDPYMNAVGRIATLWAALEFNINEAIWELANVEAAAGACITSQIGSVGPRMRALISLVHFRKGNDNILRELATYMRAIEGLSRQRNRYIHDPATIGKESGKISRINVTADLRLDFGFKDVDLKEMARIFQKVRDAIKTFSTFRQRITPELPSWPRTQFEQSAQGVQSHLLPPDTDTSR
jgi:hypothetical protein